MITKIVSRKDNLCDFCQLKIDFCDTKGHLIIDNMNFDENVLECGGFKAEKFYETYPDKSIENE